VACGVSRAGPSEVLSLFELSGGAVLHRPTSLKLAPPPASGEPRFGCRLSVGRDFAAVVVAESEEKPRLVWVSTASGESALLGGPVPLLPAYVQARMYDVAVSGALTAVAYVDNPTGAARITVQIYDSPGGIPIETLRGNEGVSLGAFSTGRVRLVRAAQGFVLAFDASVAGGARTDTIYRVVACGP
jgi:hypothetical protein